MLCEEKLIQYLKENYTPCDVLDILSQNTLFHRFGENFKILEDWEIKARTVANMWSKYLSNVAISIFVELGKRNIKYITFKGCILSQLLYGSPSERRSGDIDFFVAPQYFNEVYTLFSEKGYRLLEENGLENQHHIVLGNDKTIIELHRHIFAPQIGLDESYLRKNVDKMKFPFGIVSTFNASATYLHLLYHLYMDSYLACDDFNFVLMYKKVPKAPRFLYRAFEIALFAEKYFNDIHWEEIAEDFKKQKLRSEFLYMINDMLSVFPEAVPSELLHTVRSLSFVDAQDKSRFLSVSNLDCNNVGKALSTFIEKNWNCNKTAIVLEIGQYIEKEKRDSQHPDELFSCKTTLLRMEAGVQFVFRVSNRNLFLSSNDNFDVQQSDGVHLLLCSTQDYTYRSTFFIPKLENGLINIKCYDVINNVVLESQVMQAELRKYENYYIMNIILYDEFLEINHMKNEFYMGYVISDCDNSTGKRVNELFLADPASEWYNPLYFAKVIL